MICNSVVNAIVKAVRWITGHFTWTFQIISLIMWLSCDLTCKCHSLQTQYIRIEKLVLLSYFRIEYKLYACLNSFYTQEDICATYIAIHRMTRKTLLKSVHVTAGYQRTCVIISRANQLILNYYENIQMPWTINSIKIQGHINPPLRWRVLSVAHTEKRS